MSSSGKVSETEITGFSSVGDESIKLGEHDIFGFLISSVVALLAVPTLGFLLDRLRVGFLDSISLSLS
ncbi:hypothetical protein V6N13_119001 [Hibiscus sabdariffa]